MVATCQRCADETHHTFARLLVEQVGGGEFSSLNDTLAESEGLSGGGEELRSVLRRFYPSISSGDHVTVVHFSLSEPNAAECKTPMLPITDL